MFSIKKTKLHKALAHALGNLEALTKRLKVMQESPDSPRKKIVISTKELYVSSLGEGTKMVVEAHSDKSALFIRPAKLSDGKTRVVSKRTYKNRDYVEPVVDIRHQKDINATIGDAEYVHVTFQKDGAWVRPATKYQEIALKQPSGARFDMTMPDEEGLYSQILKAIKITKQSHFSSIILNTSDDFLQSKEYVILCVQLRRLGFAIKEMNNLVYAKLPRSPELDSHKNIDLASYNYKTNFKSMATRFNFNEPLSSFAACTAGVDIHAMENEGFKTTSILEYRPPEKRDFKKSIDKTTGETVIKHNDKTDTGALCALLNSKHAKVVFNEDIYEFDFYRVRNLLSKFNHLHCSIQCDDFSNMKSNSLKDNSIDDLSTAIDMFIPALELADMTNTPTMLVENVANFGKSIECRLLTTGLKWLGHEVETHNYNAADFNGMTKRVRAYLFSSQLGLDDIKATPVPRQAHAWNDVIAPRLNELRDVTHCKTIKKGIDTGRIRVINVGDAIVPTIVKSQSRQVKDSVYVYMNGRYYMPSNDMLKALMGIPADFNTAPFSEEITSEITGQSIEYPMHQAICEKIKQHIYRFVKSFYDLKMITMQA